MHTTDRWVIGHILSRSRYPELTWEVTNWQPEHRACSDASGQAEVIAKAKAEALAEAGFPRERGDFEPPPLPFSLQSGPFGPVEPREGLEWDPDALKAYPWLLALLEVPEDASPPLAMSRPPADAVGSYGAQAVEWIETTQKITLRWWQRLAIVRQLEHRADGTLVHRQVIESAPRRSGKSVRLRGVALWRMEHGPELFGEVQTVVHCGNDLPICREIQRGAWRWAEERWGRNAVTRGNGKEAIEADDGSRWLVRSQDGVYGWDACLALVDEAWDVKPDTISEGLEPAMLERLSPQLHITSTAHRRARSTMRTRLVEALTMDDPGTLLLLWAAPADADPGDPETWKAASPHWSEDRRQMIASKYEKALAGQADPEADDPDPMQGFLAQYLNRWRLTHRATQRGEVLVTEETWTGLQVEPPIAIPDAAAIEGWPGEGLSLALAWSSDGAAVVSVTDYPDLTSAVEALQLSGFRGTAVVGSSLNNDPALRPIRRRKGEGRTVNAVSEMARLLAENAVLHDGSEQLRTQLLGVRTMPSTDGLRVISTGRADAVKAACWAVARTMFGRSQKVAILLPTTATPSQRGSAEDAAGP